jgi:hypothetical protein
LVRGGSRAFARISSHPLGRYVAVTNPAPPRCRSNGFQRILCGSPYHPRRAETAERATWDTKTPPRPPHSRPAPARVRRKPRRWGPLVRIWGGLPGRWRRPRPAAALNRVSAPRAVPRAPRMARPNTKRHRTHKTVSPGLPSYEN